MTNIQEIWKSIEGYEGIYEVSNLGRVKRLSRDTFRGGRKYQVKEIIMQPQDNGRYFHIGISPKANLKETLLVHRLVAKAFCENPENKKTVNHINGMRYDNRAENLEWATQSENLYHAFRIGLHKPYDMARKNHPQAKKICIVDTETNETYFYECLRDAGDALKIDARRIGDCINNIRTDKKLLKYQITRI